MRLSLPWLRLNRNIPWNRYCACGGAATATGALVGAGVGLEGGGEGLASCGGGFGGLACTLGIGAGLGEAALGDDSSGGGGGEAEAEGGDAQVCRGGAGGCSLLELEEAAPMSKTRSVSSDSACDGCDSTAAAGGSGRSTSGGSGRHTNTKPWFINTSPSSSTFRCVPQQRAPAQPTSRLIRPRGVQLGVGERQAQCTFARTQLSNRLRDKTAAWERTSHTVSPSFIVVVPPFMATGTSWPPARCT